MSQLDRESPVVRVVTVASAYSFVTRGVNTGWLAIDRTCEAARAVVRSRLNPYSG